MVSFLETEGDTPMPETMVPVPTLLPTTTTTTTTTRSFQHDAHAAKTAGPSSTFTQSDNDLLGETRLASPNRAINYHLPAYLIHHQRYLEDQHLLQPSYTMDPKSILSESESSDDALSVTQEEEEAPTLPEKEAAPKENVPPLPSREEHDSEGDTMAWGAGGSRGRSTLQKSISSTPQKQKSALRKPQRPPQPQVDIHHTHRSRTPKEKVVEKVSPPTYSRIAPPKRAMTKETIDKKSLSTAHRALFDLPIASTTIGPYRLLDPQRGHLHQLPFETDAEIRQESKENTNPFAAPSIASSKRLQQQAASIQQAPFDQQAAAKMCYKDAAKVATKVLDVPLSHLNYPPKLPSPRRRAHSAEGGDHSQDDEQEEEEAVDRLKGPNGIKLYTKPRFTGQLTSTLLPTRRPTSAKGSSHDQGALRVRPGMEAMVSQLKEREKQGVRGPPRRRAELYHRGAHRHCSPERQSTKQSVLPPGASGVINFEQMFWVADSAP